MPNAPQTAEQSIPADPRAEEFARAAEHIDAVRENLAMAMFLLVKRDLRTAIQEGRTTFTPQPDFACGQSVTFELRNARLSLIGALDNLEETMRIVDGG